MSEIERCWACDNPGMYEQQPDGTVMCSVCKNRRFIVTDTIREAAEAILKLPDDSLVIFESWPKESYGTLIRDVYPPADLKALARAYLDQNQVSPEGAKIVPEPVPGYQTILGKSRYWIRGVQYEKVEEVPF